MKKTLTTIAFFGLLTGISHAAAVTVALYAGTLAIPDGQPLPNGSLVQVLVSTVDTTFGEPQPLSFVGSQVDDVVAFSFVMDSTTTGVAGNSLAQFSLVDTPGFYNGKTLAQGMPMLLRWWPSKALNGQPAALDPYGEYRNTNSIDGSIPWTVPSIAAGGSVDLSFITADQGGSNAQVLGRASHVVPVPEPSVALLSIVGVGSLFGRRRRR